MQLVKKTSIFLIIIFLLSIIVLGLSYDIGYAEGSDPPETSEEPVPDPTPEITPEPVLSNNATLTKAFVNGIEVSAANNWYVKLEYGQTDARITAQTEDEKATVDGAGDHPLGVGQINHITLTVTAEDGVTQQSYTINIEIDESPTISGPFTISIDHSHPWCNPCYEYKSQGIKISDTVCIFAKVHNISSDYTVNATINGKPVSDIEDKNYSVSYYDDSTMLDIICEYYKEVNFGDDINKSASFPSVDIKITITDNQSGQTETITHSSKARTYPCAYDAYFNHRYDKDFRFESSFVNYIQDKRIDKNEEDIAENKEQIEENAEAIEENAQGIIAIQTDIGELNCRVDELESDVENLRRMLFTFFDEFKNNPNLETIDFWYRENPQEVAFRFSDLFFTTAHAADEDWMHIVLDRTNYEVELEFDKNKQYDVYWVANYADETSSQEYYQIVPNSKELIVETDASNMQIPYNDQQTSTEPSSVEDTAGQDKKVQLSDTDKPENTENQQGITTTTLIIVIAVALVLGGGIGMLGFMFGSKKRTNNKA